MTIVVVIKNNEKVGHTRPIPRRQALEEMVLRGMDASEAVNALCWYKQVSRNGKVRNGR